MPVPLEGESGDVVELLGASVDLFSSEAAKAFQTELLHGKAAHH
jgi:hypothetical protein